MISTHQKDTTPETKAITIGREFREASMRLDTIILTNSDRIPREVGLALLTAQHNMLQALDDLLAVLRKGSITVKKMSDVR